MPLAAGLSKPPPFKMEKSDDPEPILAELRSLGFEDAESRLVVLHLRLVYMLQTCLRHAGTQGLQHAHDFHGSGALSAQPP